HHLQSGGPELAAFVRGVSFGEVHERPGENGGIRQPALVEGSRLDDGGDHPVPERLSRGADLTELDVGHFGFWICDFGFRTSRFQSPVSNFEFRTACSRRSSSLSTTATRTPLCCRA